MSDTTRSYGIEITADGKVAVAASREVKDSLDDVSAAGKRLADSSGVITQAQVNAAYASQKAAEQYRAQAESLGSASVQVQKLLDRYDPLGTKLRSLQSDFALLNKAAMGGEIGSGSDAAVDKTYKALNEEISRTKDLMAQAGAATAGSAGSMVSLGLNTQMARRELMQLGREAISGDFSRMPVTLGSLVAHSQILPALLNPITLAVVAIGAAAGVMAVAFSKGHSEAVAMANALSTTNDYAGMTRSQMISMADSVSRAGTLTVGAAKDIVTQVVASGRYGSENVGLLARLTENYAAVTGESVSKVTPQLIKMFEDPARASEALNAQYHYLGVEELKRIQTLQDSGRMQEAATVAIKALSDHLPKHAENLSKIDAIWIAIKKSASEGWAAMVGGTQAETLEQKLAAAQANVAKLGGTHQAEGAVSPALQQALAVVEALQKQIDVQKILADGKATIARIDEVQLKAQASINQSATARITLLTAERDQVAANGVASQDKARRVYELNKEIGDLQRGLSAEGRAMFDQQQAGALALSDIQSKAAIDEVNAQVSLGNVTKQQGAAAILAIELEQNARKQMAVSAKLDTEALSALQRQGYQQELQQLAATANALRDKYNTKVLVDWSNALQQQADADASAAQASTDLYFKTMEGLDKSIAAQKLHNSEIGKTKEQVDRLKAAETDRAIRELQNQESILASDAGVSDAADAAIARIEAQIAKLTEFQKLQISGAVQDALASTAKRDGQEFERMFNAVEHTGKTVFEILAQGGEGMASRVGKAIKSSIADLLYQLTLRPITVQIAGSIAQGAGINLAGTSLGQAAGSGGSLINGASLASKFSSMGEAPAWYTQGLQSGEIVGGGLTTGVSAASYTGLGTASTLGATDVAYGAGAVGGAEAGTFLGMGPVGWIALAVVAVYAYMSSKGGGPKQNAWGTIDTSNNWGGATGGDSTALQAGFRANMAEAASLYAMAGLTAPKMSATGGFENDPLGTAAAQYQRTLNIGGKSIGTGLVNLGSGDQMAAISAGMSQLSMKEITDLLEIIGDPALTTTVGNLAANVGVLDTQFKDIGTALAGYSMAMASQKELLFSMMTPQQQLDNTTANLRKTFSDLNLVAPTTRDEFAAIVNGLDLTTRAGQETLITLTQIGPAFTQTVDAWNAQITANAATAKTAADAAVADAAAAAQVIATIQQERVGYMSTAEDALRNAYQSQATALTDTAKKWQDAAAALRQYGTSLLGSTSTGAASYAIAASQFADVSARARLGDKTAVDQLQSVSEAFRVASLANSSTREDYLRDIGKIRSALADTASVADRQSSIAQQQLDALTAQVSGLITINTSVLSVEQAIRALGASITGLVSGAGGGAVTGPVQTEHALNTSTGLAWVSRAGAVGTLRTGQALGQGQIHATDGNIYTVQQAYDFINGQVAAGDLMSVYRKALETGVSLNSVNLLGGFPAGSAEDWARSQGLPVFHAGTPFVQNTGPAFLQRGERVTSAPANDELVSEMKALRQGVTELQREMSSQKQASSETAATTRRMFDLWRRVTRDGESLVTIAA